MLHHLFDRSPTEYHNSGQIKIHHSGQAQDAPPPPPPPIVVQGHNLICKRPWTDPRHCPVIFHTPINLCTQIDKTVTVQAIRNITFTFKCEFAYEFAKTKEKIHARISEIRARILKEESNLCTNLNKPTRLHQDRNSKTSYFDNFMVSF